MLLLIVEFSVASGFLWWLSLGLIKTIWGSVKSGVGDRENSEREREREIGFNRPVNFTGLPQGTEGRGRARDVWWLSGIVWTLGLPV